MTDTIRELRELLAACQEATPTVPWRISTEPREDGRTCLETVDGGFTVLTVGDYYDGGRDEQEAALALIVAAVNALPALLDIAEAAEKWSEAEDAWDAHPMTGDHDVRPCEACAAVALYRRKTSSALARLREPK